MEELHTQILMDLQIGSLLGDREAQQQLEKLMTQGASAGLVGGFKKAQTQIESNFIQTFGRAAKAGLLPAAQKLEKAFERGNRIITATGEVLSKLNRDLATAEQRTDRAASARIQKEIAAAERVIRMEQTALDKEISKTEKSAQKRAAILKEAQEEASKDWTEKLGDGASGFSDKVDSALNFNDLDFKGMGQSLSKGMKKGGGRLTSWGANVMKNPASSGAAKGMAKAAMALGKLAGPLTGVVIGLTAMAAAVWAGYNNAKEMNKAFLEGSAAADMFAGSTGDLNKNLNSMRRNVLNIAQNFRMTSAEVVETMTAFNKAGMTFKQMQGYLGETMSVGRAYGTIAQNAIVASKSMGVEISEIASFAEKLNKDMGFGLTRVNDGFALIYSQAGKAGMTVRDFYTAVSEASSGMALYNFRLEDTVNLLTTMQGILGEDAAREQVGGLKGQYRNMGTLDRYKTTMLTGLGTTQKIQAADLRAQAKVLGDVIGRDLSGATGPASNLLTSSGKVDTDLLATMSADQYRAVRGAISQSGEQGQTIARQLDNMYDLAKGATGNRFDAAAGMGALSQTGTLAMQLSTMATKFPEGIHKIEGMNRAMFENITGIQGEQFGVLTRLDRALRSDYERLVAQGDERLQKEGGGTMDFAEAVASGVFSESADIDAEMLAAQPEMQRIAQATMMETRSVSQTLKNKIAGVLDSIWGGVQGLLSFGAGSSQERATANAVSTMSEQLEKIRDDRRGTEKELTGVRASLTTAKDPAEIQRLQMQERQLQAVIDRSEGHEEVMRRQISRTASGLNTGDPFTEMATALENYMAVVDTPAIAAGTSRSSIETPSGGVRTFSDDVQTVRALLTSPAAGMAPIELMGGPSGMGAATLAAADGDRDRLAGRDSPNMLSLIQDKINLAIEAGVGNIFVGSGEGQTSYSLAGLSRETDSVALGLTGTSTGSQGDDRVADAIAARIILEQAKFYTDAAEADKISQQGMKGMTKAEKETMKKLKLAIRDQTSALLAGQDIRELADALGTTSSVVRESIGDKSGAGFAALSTLFSALPQGDREGVGELLNRVGRPGRDLSMIGGAITFDPMDTVVMATKRGGSMRDGGGGGGIFNFNFTGVDEQKVFAIIRRALAQAGIRGGGNAR